MARHRQMVQLVRNGYIGQLKRIDVWSRDVSSLSGIVMDNRHLYITDDRGAIHALDKATGTSVWKQDKLSYRQLTLPLPELAVSYLHMHANRLLRSAHRAQELVLYDFLARLYQSQAALEQ